MHSVYSHSRAQQVSNFEYQNVFFVPVECDEPFPIIYFIGTLIFTINFWCGDVKFVKMTT